MGASSFASPRVTYGLPVDRPHGGALFCKLTGIEEYSNEY